MNTIKPMEEFEKFRKMPRLSREMIITEKIDGTNAQIFIGEDDEFLTGSRNRWITPEDDNYGFSAWAHENKEMLMGLGMGRHYGEWWGQGIQRKYGLDERRFSLFNTLRWCEYGREPQQIPKADPRIIKMQDILPKGIGLVPVLYRAEFNTETIDIVLDQLKRDGSQAVPGFMKPEGVVVFHVAGNFAFKKTIENDGQPKGK